MRASGPSSSLLPVDHYDLTAADTARLEQEWALGMVRPHDPVLRKTAKPVEVDHIGTPAVKDVVSRLMTVASSQQVRGKQPGARRMLVGLAAPQIGEGLRIFVADTRVTVDRKRAGKLECFINPHIIWSSRETEEDREGCFSAGLVWGLVRRSVAVKIGALAPSGKYIERIFEGFTARIMQHELDHLNGVRFPDRIKNDAKRHWVHTEEMLLYPENIHHWHRLCTEERWNKLKGVS